MSFNSNNLSFSSFLLFFLRHPHHRLSPTYGEILALRHNYKLDEDDLAALAMILPALNRADVSAPSTDGQHNEARAAQVCLKIFNQIENAVFVFEDAHWIDSQTWVLMQMLLAQLSVGSLVLIVTRPPTMTSQLRAGGAEGLSGIEEDDLDDLVEEDDRIKFSRILKSLKVRMIVLIIVLYIALPDRCYFFYLLHRTVTLCSF